MPTGGMISAPRSLKKSAFAREVGLSAGRISQLIREGLPVEVDGRIDVARGKLWIKGNVSPTRSAAQSSQDDLPFPAQRDAAEERVRLLREQADGQALKNAQLRRELVASAEVEREWASMLRHIRSEILAVPSRLRQTMPHLTAEDIGAIDAELRRLLEGLANGQ